MADEKTLEEQLKAALDRILVAEAILGHALPDVDLEKEADNVAFRRDGSAVYIGDISGAKAETKPETSETKPEEGAPEASASPDAPSPTPTPTNVLDHPALRRGNTTEATPDLSKMSHEELAKHYREVALPSVGGTYRRELEA